MLFFLVLKHHPWQFPPQEDLANGQIGQNTNMDNSKTMHLCELIMGSHPCTTLYDTMQDGSDTENGLSVNDHFSRKSQRTESSHSWPDH